MDDDVKEFIGASVANRLFQDTRPRQKKIVGVIGAEWASIVVWHGDDLKGVIARRRGPDPHTVERCGARSSRLPLAARMDVMKPFRHETTPIGLGVAAMRGHIPYIQMSGREIYSSEKDKRTVLFFSHCRDPLPDSTGR
jgi:hypothetical protein